MNEHHTDQLTDHEYDGIREYDNPTPGWWHAIFASTIVFAAIYAIFWHCSDFSWSIQDSWTAAQVAESKRIFGSVGDLRHDEATLVGLMGNKDFMAIAKGHFLGTCAACHKRDGGGDVGVNLCDDSYKNVARIEDIYKIITEGANSGAMPSWRNKFSDNERVILAAYVASLRGTTPAAGKGPEGNVIPPWPALPSAAAGSPEKKPAAAPTGS